jgi:uracil-DNA glycosylase
METKTDLMRAVRDDLLAFTDSPLYEYRKANNYFPVAGEGSHNAKIVFIGEAPGKNEALTGRPFCGAAGKLLDELLTSIGIDRKTVYITNIVKDRPPENRDPTEEEIAAYAPFLDRQLEIIAPQIITTLGRFSMAYIMTKFGLASELRSIGQIHGQKFETETPFGKVTIIPFYHPAAALYATATKEALKQDFQILKNLR